MKKKRSGYMKIKIYTNQEYIKEKLKDKYDNIELINIDDISKYKGDILILDLDDIKDLNDDLYNCCLTNTKYDLYEYDRLNRYKYKNYKKVYIVAHDEYFSDYSTYKNQYSNIYFVHGLTVLYFTNLSVNNDSKKISNIKNNNILKLKKYVDSKKDYFDSKSIMKLFNVSNRWIKRYMKDMNDIYNNVGYSYTKRKWYKTKKR